jgi:hypothetical protein
MILAGCGAKEGSPAPEAQLPPGDSAAVVVTGIVRKAEVGVGCWQLIGNDSTHYELRAGQAPESILVDQRQVTVSIKHRTDLMSTCQVGKIVDVVSVVH